MSFSRVNLQVDGKTFVFIGNTTADGSIAGGTADMIGNVGFDLGSKGLLNLSPVVVYFNALHKSSVAISTSIFGPIETLKNRGEV